MVHQVGMPWVFGWEGYARGDIANVLLAISGDPNTSIHTTKALTCALRQGTAGAARRQRPWPMTFTPRRCRRSTSCWRSGRRRWVHDFSEATGLLVALRDSQIAAVAAYAMPSRIASGWR